MIWEIKYCSSFVSSGFSKMSVWVVCSSHRIIIDWVNLVIFGGSASVESITELVLGIIVWDVWCLF